MKPLIGLILASMVLLTACATPGGRDAPAGTAGTPAPATPTAKAGEPELRASTGMTVGDLLAKGGKQLTKAENEKLASGATLHGRTDTARWKAVLAAGGNFTGEAVLNDGRVVRNFGNWYIDNLGRNCSVNRARAGAGPDCKFYFNLDGKYYASVGDSSNQASALEERAITR